MSKIQWTEETWNPLAGCKEISPGCTNCYAAKMAKRLEAMGQKKYAGTTRTLDNGKVVWTGKINMDEGSLTLPLRTKKPTMWFVNSMSDLFHEDVPDEFIDRTFAVMALCRQHTFQVLTKRAERMAAYWTANFRRNAIDNAKCEIMGEMPDQGRLSDAYIGEEDSGYFEHGKYLDNCWLGVSVEDQQRADERIPHLLKTPAAIRFLSCEPLLGQIEFSDVSRRADAISQLGKKALSGIDWVIIGGESGPKARPCDLAWIRSLVKQCQEAGTRCFVKQLGSRPVDMGTHLDWPEGIGFRKDPDFGNGARVILKDPKGGDLSELPADLRIRQMPEVSLG